MQSKPLNCKYNDQYSIIASISLFLLFLASLIKNDALFLALSIIFSLACFVVLQPKLYIYFVVIATPFTYIITVFLYNTQLFLYNFKLIAAIKLLCFIIVPVTALLISNFKKCKFDIFDYTILAYLFFCTVYYFVGDDVEGTKMANYMQMVPFAIYLILGKLVYLARIKIETLERIYLRLCIIVIIVGIAMYFASDKLNTYNLSPKAYSIESVGMHENQFMGEFAASSYSFIFQDTLGYIKRFFSIFYSGIGMAYFSSIGFIIAFYRKKRIFMIVILAAIIATITRGVWILSIISPIFVWYLISKSKMAKIVAASILLLSLLASLLVFKSILIDYFIEGKTSTFDFTGIDQSSAAHLVSILILYDIIRNKIFGYGMGFSSGESFLVDVFARIGIFGFMVFVFLFFIQLKRIKAFYLSNHHIECQITLCLLVFNLLGSLFSRENYTIIDSYMSWIYIGYVYNKYITSANK